MRKVYFLLALAVCCSLFSYGFYKPEPVDAQITSASFVCDQNAFTHMMNISDGQVISGNYLLQAYANPYVSGFPDSKIAKLEFKTMGNGLIANALPSTSTFLKLHGILPICRMEYIRYSHKPTGTSTQYPLAPVLLIRSQ